MRVVFFGTPRFALPTLGSLIEHPAFEVVAVVTQPDRPSGRGRKLQPTPIKALAREQGIPVWQPERLRKDADVLQQLDHLQADVFVVVAYGQLLPLRVLQMPRLGCVNVHGSLLPAYRGAAPIQWAVANGESQTGVTTMLMDPGMDTGAMLLKAKVEISSTHTSEDLAEILAPLGADLLIETLLKLEAGSLEPEPQNDALATYAPLLSRTDFELNWRQPAPQLHNRIRGFYPECFTFVREERLKVLESHPPQQTPVHITEAAQPGAILAILKQQGIVVQTGQGALLLTHLQPAGRKAASAWDVANGLRLQIGEQLGHSDPTDG
jgi:methionyl-tRNA formyltransferase